MSNLRKVAQARALRLDDPEVRSEIACQNERKNLVAARIGLPTIGSKMVNQYGIEWVVQNHAQVPTFDSLQRWRAGQIDAKNDLYPVVAPMNLSPRLMEFIHAIDRCTTKTFAILDTMPGRRNDGHVPGGNSIDTVSNPATNLLFLDAARVHETVIAHEFGHAWVQYVDECDDLRVVDDASDPQRMRQVNFVQSFVLDLKVNDLVRRKGFDMSPIEDDQAASMAQLAAALESGYRPEHPREEVFMSLVVADQIVQRDLGRSNELARFDESLVSIRESNAPLARLAESMAASVGRHGYEAYDAIIRCIDECLVASFEHVGETFDLDSELSFLDLQEPDVDKFPEWLPRIPPKLKCKVGKHMAQNDITSARPHHVEPALTERTKVIFESPQDGSRSQVLVDHRIGPPTQYFGISEDHAELLELRRQNEQRMDALTKFGSPLPDHVKAAMDLVRNIRKTGTELQREFANAVAPNRVGRPYMAGLGRFLTAARLQEINMGEQPYAYAQANPITYTDPTGLLPGGPKPPIVEVRGCTSDQEKIIRKALGDLCNDRLQYIGDPKARACAKKQCDNPVTVYCRPGNDPNCHPGSGDCSFASYDNTDTIHLCPPAFNQKGDCGCMGSTLLWEMLNNCGHPPGKDSPLCPSSADPYPPTKKRPPCP